MKLAEFAKGSITFLVVIAAGFLSTTFVDRHFVQPKYSKFTTPEPSACISADVNWKNWPWPNVSAYSQKCPPGL